MPMLLMRAVNVYSKKRDANQNLTENFKVSEFACNDGTDLILVHPLLPEICQAIRNKFGVPFSPNAAYRTVAQNIKVEGKSDSLHIYGMAVDIKCFSGVTAQQLYDYVDGLLGDWGELELYSWGIHIGITDTMRRVKG